MASGCEGESENKGALWALNIRVEQSSTSEEPCAFGKPQRSLIRSMPLSPL